MSRVPGDVQAELGTLLPDGWAWNHDPGSNTMRSMAGLAGSVATFEAAAEAQLFESEPEDARLMLEDYERVLGPDTCLGDPSALTFGERQRSASARWITPGSASIAGLVALAAAYGVAISITEKLRNCVGVLRAGGPVRCHPQQFTWVVGLPDSQVVRFRAGASHAGESIGRIVRNVLVECVIRRAAPGHTVPVFAYATTPGSEQPLDDFLLDQNVPA